MTRGRGLRSSPVTSGSRSGSSGAVVVTTILREAALLGLIAVLAVLPAQAAPRTAPAFSLELFDGRTLTLDSLRGSAVILLFWAPW